jgi:hypothetical protein
MGFDDLAKHMASRDRKQVPIRPADLDKFLADGASADRRTSRVRDLILGALLLVGGGVVLALYVLYLLDAMDTTRHPDRHEVRFTLWGPIVMAVAAGAMVVGLRQLVRGLRGRSP